MRGHVACMLIRESPKNIRWKPEGKRQLGSAIFSDGKLLLKWILKKPHGLVKRDKSESQQSPVASCCEHGKEHLRFKIHGQLFN